MRSKRKLSKIKCKMRFAIFSYNLRVTRENFGLSQAELAAKCEIGLNTYARIEGNKAKPKGETMILICETLGGGLDEMMIVLRSEKMKLNEEIKLIKLPLIFVSTLYILYTR